MYWLKELIEIEAMIIGATYGGVHHTKERLLMLPNDDVVRIGRTKNK